LPQGPSTASSQLLEQTAYGFRWESHERPNKVPGHGRSSATAAEQNMKTNMTRRGPRQNAEPSKFRHAEAPQNARRNYDRYLALAQAEIRNGDPIAAENYYQHAEHYLRSMHQSDARA
jgi:hypothetical protein